MQQNKIQHVNLMKTIFIFISAILAFSLPAIAQDQLNKLSGKVMYDNKTIVDDAMVSILDAKDNSVIVSGITELDGTFSFAKLNTGKYMISVQVYGQPIKLYGPITIGDKGQHTVMETFYLNNPRATSEIIISSSRLK